VEAMPNGGTLTLSSKFDRDLVIAIHDTGSGIPRNQFRKIFLPFFTTKDKGIGMGLALTHKIISAHGGRVEVESREGSGTTFTIILPKE
jgi:signal transduction histidine kinase